MDYLSYTTNVNCLPKAKFDAFYMAATEIILEAMSMPSSEKSKSEKNKTLEELLSEHDLIIKNTDQVMRKLTPALTTNLYAPTMEAMNACPACSVCALCACCGEVNGGAGVAFVAGVLSVFSK